MEVGDHGIHGKTVILRVAEETNPEFEYVTVHVQHLEEMNVSIMVQTHLSLEHATRIHV